MNVSDVFASGTQVVSEGKLIKEQKRLAPPGHFLETVIVPEITEEDLAIRVDGPAAVSEVKCRVISYPDTNRLPTQFSELVLPVVHGEVIPENYQGEEAPLNYIAVFHRHGKNNNRSVGILNGYGITAGAVVTTIAHDSHHLAVLGTNKKDMALAANRAREIQGGIVAAKDGEIVAELHLPLAGLMSLDTAHEFGPKLNEFISVLQSTVLPRQHPIMRLVGVTLPVIPHAKITDLGYVYVDTQELLPLFV
ncbi:adenine deaminase C-terminal domain-containing protein [Paenibacillus alkalitolerans]|uniref:adenine deaminase C-terminal domain-containing protein n=1 Tax=Paenibacillus alkalitolerans TaxID=2799335 RepID=UPI0018F768AF|nr:adenine deaminase C-terminal domain-containing protein [Paenibacillus alkalitolerans]